MKELCVCVKGCVCVRERVAGDTDVCVCACYV